MRLSYLYGAGVLDDPGQRTVDPTPDPHPCSYESEMHDNPDDYCTCGVERQSACALSV